MADFTTWQHDTLVQFAEDAAQKLLQQAQAIDRLRHTVEELVNEQQPLGTDRAVYQRALSLLVDNERAD